MRKWRKWEEEEIEKRRNRFTKDDEVSRIEYPPSSTFSASSVSSFYEMALLL
jgi:hypothetical protein